MLDQAAYNNGLPWNVSTDGLRNLTGQSNANASFTVFATTSTVSNGLTHDLGADPNEIVFITVGAGSTNANTPFSVLKTAGYGERFGGVALAPVPGPETYALMLAGLAGLALLKRRRGARPAG